MVALIVIVMRTAEQPESFLVWPLFAYDGLRGHGSVPGPQGGSPRFQAYVLVIGTAELLLDQCPQPGTLFNRPGCSPFRPLLTAYPGARVVRLVLDNLNTRRIGSPYEAFEPDEGMAEIESSVLSKL